MDTNKFKRREAIRTRARKAIAALYHNATPRYPRTDDPSFDGWFNQIAEAEIDYLNFGGAYGNDYHQTLCHTANGGAFKSLAARNFYCDSKMAAMRHERDKYARHEWITKYGTLGTYGRGGRTLAPSSLAPDYLRRDPLIDDYTIEECVDLIRIVEAFNAYVAMWCASIPDQWQEYCAERAEFAAQQLLDEAREFSMVY